jgi:RimJ/RimL family protein N-acetyltransferase
MYSAQDLGVPGLSLSVEDGNRDARALYEKVGYIPTGRNGNADTMMLALTPPALILPSAEPSAG